MLAVVAVAVAWFPAETRPWSPVAVAVTILALTSWAWRRSGRDTMHRLAVAFTAVTTAAVSGAAGWDAARGVGEIALAAAAVSLIWIASRVRPSPTMPVALAAGISGLALWGLWQSGPGLTALAADLDGLSGPARSYAAERLASGRAFASLPLPSHLGALLATALPLLIGQLRTTRRGAVFGVLAAIAVAGLVATRSPVAIGLAFAAAVSIVTTGRRWVRPLAAGAFVAVLAAVAAVRPDVTALEPVALRLDNWRTAAWLSSTSPAAGIGVAGFAQASQASPLVVGNRPAHAHSLPMEALAELGPVGFCAVVLGALWLIGLMRDLWRTDRAVAAAVAVIPLHNLVDFSIFVSGVALPWAVLVGWAAAIRRRRPAATIGSPPAVRTLMLAATAIAVGLTVLHASSVATERAAATATAPADRLTGARTALEMAPWRIEPQFLVAEAAIAGGDSATQWTAWAELDRRRWWRPRSAALAERRARLALARGDVSAALAELRIAVEFGGPASESAMRFRELVRDLERHRR